MDYTKDIKKTVFYNQKCVNYCFYTKRVKTMIISFIEY